jgi:hypothetical protein
VGGVAAQFFTNTGAVLTGGKLYTYAAGTTTPAVAFTSSNGGTAQPNPIVLDAAGRVPGSGEIWLTDGITYKFLLKDSNDVLIATYDNVSGINSNFIAFTNSQQIITATASQTVFNLSISYQPGTNSLSVFVDGVNQYGPGAQYAYLETDADTVTFVNGLHVGALVKFTTTQQQGAGAVNASQVTYNPAGANAVATNVQAKLRESVSVLDFGADNTGVTDCRNAFVAALAASKAVFVPVGTYKIDSTVTITTGRSLEFASGCVVNFSSTVDNLFVVQRDTNLIGNGTTINFTNAASTKAAIYLNGQQWFLNTTPTAIGGFYIVGASTVNNIGILLDTTAAPILANTGISFVRFFDMSFDNLNIGLFLSSGNLVTQYINANAFTNFFWNRTLRPFVATATSPSEIAGNSFFNFQIQSYGEVLPINPSILLTGAVNRNYFNALQMWDWTGVGNQFIINGGSGNYIQSNVLYSQITNAVDQVLLDLSGNFSVPANSLGLNNGQQRFGSATHVYAANERVTIASTVVGTGYNIQGGGASLGIGMYGGQATGATNANAMEFQNSSSAVVGSIKFNGTTTTYATTSDKDMKTDLGVATDTSVIDDTVIHDYVWTKENVADRGVFAQEAFLVKPSAVFQGTDEVNEKGNKVAPWGVDYSKYVPDLIVYVKKLKADFEAYKASHP